MSRVVRVAVLLLVVLALVAVAQQQPVIKKAPAKPTSAASGEEMYINYCASCHGTDLKGNGPAAPALKEPATDLTLLARQNQGEFPALHVQQVIQGNGTAAHGSAEMPVWGPVFRSLSQGDRALVQLRIRNLTQYIEAQQAK